MEKNDISSRADLFLLVSTFYHKVKAHEVLGPFFNTTITDWDAHIETLVTFWESSLFLKTRYTGNPVATHIFVDKKAKTPITAAHFGLWLNLWVETVDALFIGDIAENAKHRARKMATYINLKLFEARRTH
jgi:hemoglobin